MEYQVSVSEIPIFSDRFNTVYYFPSVCYFWFNDETKIIGKWVQATRDSNMSKNIFFLRVGFELVRQILQLQLCNWGKTVQKVTWGSFQNANERLSVPISKLSHVVKLKFWISFMFWIDKTFIIWCILRLFMECYIRYHVYKRNTVNVCRCLILLWPFSTIKHLLMNQISSTKKRKLFEFFSVNKNNYFIVKNGHLAHIKWNAHFSVVLQPKQISYYYI